MGESSASADLQQHILAAVQDIVLIRPWTWTLTKGSNLSLSSGTASLATDFNPKWGVVDARVVTTGSGNDSVFTRIAIEDKDKYTSDDYVYWVTWNTSTERYIFNSLTQTGTVEYYYHIFPANLSAGATLCIVPDSEAVAYLAASKMWIGDERDVKLQQVYSQEAASRIRSLVAADAAVEFDQYDVNSVVSQNSNLWRK